MADNVGYLRLSSEMEELAEGRSVSGRLARRAGAKEQSEKQPASLLSSASAANLQPSNIPAGQRVTFPQGSPWRRPAGAAEQG